MIAWTIYITFTGAVLLLLFPGVFARWITLLTTIAGLALGVVAFVRTPIADLAHFTTIVKVPWVPPLGMNYHLAIDGVSLTMVLVTGISAVSTVLFSWDVDHRQREFFFWLLLVVAGCYGVFLSADLFLFFAFYELVIVPKYFLIAIFGSTNKEYGAMKLTLYSFFGGMLVFAGILVVYVTAGSLDLNQLAQFHFNPQLQSWAFPVLFLGFAVLAGIWPLHTWAPTGHVAAPTAGSMLLAGIVMKLGSYAGRMLYRRTHTRELDALSGMNLSRALPFAAFTFVIASAASMGIPGFSGFAAEITILIGAWKTYPIAVWIIGVGMVLTAAFTLRALVKSFFSEVRVQAGRVRTDTDWNEQSITLAEKCGACLLMFATLAVGLYPKLLLD